MIPYINYMPYKWRGIIDYAVASGASIGGAETIWAAGWSKIPITNKSDPVKSAIYTAHDLTHQAWWNVDPANDYSVNSRKAYLDTQLIGEIAVLSFIEITFVRDMINERLATEEQIYKRNMLNWWEELGRPDIQEFAQVLWNTLILESTYKKWCKTRYAHRVIDDYLPMLYFDKGYTLAQFNSMKLHNWKGFKTKEVYRSSDIYLNNFNSLELLITRIKSFGDSSKPNIESEPWVIARKNFRNIPLVRF